MSKLSEPLKALINAAHAKPHTLPAPKNIASVYDRFATDAAAKKVGLPEWLTASVSSIVTLFSRCEIVLMQRTQAAATFTMNSPESLLELYGLATSSKHRKGDNHNVYAAELVREVGLKCIGLNGVIEPVKY